MRQVNIKHLQANLSKELNNLPVLITRDGVPIAMVTQYVLAEGQSPRLRSYSKADQLSLQPRR